SDKAAGRLFVYDLNGETVQVVAIDGKPGNIDLRYGFPLGGGEVDIVALNDRNHSSILVYRVDPRTRRLMRADDGQIGTGPNYGFTLYRSAKTGTFYAFTVAEEEGDGAEQYALSDNGAGRITGTKVRSWPLGHSEGCVADDDAGLLYIGEEDRGIWQVGAEPDDPTPGELIIELGPHEFQADVEGLTICPGPNGAGYLIASSQGNGQFKVFERKAPHAYVQTFTVAGANETDGIDVLNANLGPAFPGGIFALHNGSVEPCPVLVCDLRRLGLDTFTDTQLPQGR
ncbi:MAG: phytase, partial [Candidatus Hydrogenedentes bacterium]|nr:phytase [Candidatus Hydrogenedentota bacterium]